MLSFTSVLSNGKLALLIFFLFKIKANMQKKNTKGSGTESKNR